MLPVHGWYANGSEKQKEGSANHFFFTSWLTLQEFWASVLAYGLEKFFGLWNTVIYSCGFDKVNLVSYEHHLPSSVLSTFMCNKCLTSYLLFPAANRVHTYLIQSRSSVLQNQKVACGQVTVRSSDFWVRFSYTMEHLSPESWSPCCCCLGIRAWRNWI